MTAALDADDQARIAAQIVLDVGLPAVERYLPEWRIDPPRPGVHVLACRCGRALDAADMHRAGTGLAGPNDPDCLTIRRITCAECA
jgi:hypothetical protein